MNPSTFEEIEAAHKDLNATFLAASVPSLFSTSSTPNVKSNSPFPPLSLPYRAHQLRQLARLVQENTEAILASLATDLGKPRQEIIMTELQPVVLRSLACADKVDGWIKDASHQDVLQGPIGGGDTVPDWQKSWKGRVENRAKGVVLIISPWNYPVILSLQPLYGAITAGCPAVIKPSEMVPTFSTLLAQLVAKYLDPAAYRVILGAVPEITKLLELKWDHIMYTGNGRVARIISAAAAKHLTPLTLELGGKSPVIVDPATCGDLDIAAKRIIWGKINNSGQICVAPDYVLIPKPSIPAFTSAVGKALKEFYPNGPLSSDDYGRIVNDAHFQRIKGILSQTKGKVVLGGQTGSGGPQAKDRGIEPTLVAFETIKEAEADIAMQDELFAPLLPVVGVENVAEACAFVRRRDHPLVIYAFTEDDALKKAISDATMSGNLVFNDTFQQLAADLPFGGVGESGYGRQVGFYSAQEFLYPRAVVDIPQSDEPHMGFRYPPATQKSMEFFTGPLKTQIPETPLPAGHAQGHAVVGNAGQSAAAGHAIAAGGAAGGADAGAAADGGGGGE
ncbi:Aldehyde/histidinol dehydrogenase [Coprinopsis sp. MPI-PUGE-AT-0042]|nr:Aldehyde/histidinol dehydrogenase [Coprinopsis sp. MPI-PUGE-AT-0042]